MLKKKLEVFNSIFHQFGQQHAILTAGNKTIGFNCLTVSWGGIGVLWGKNVGFVFVRKSRHTYQFLESSDSITLSFLPEEYQEIVDKIIGRVSGKEADKVSLAGLHFTYDPDYDGAYIAEAQQVLKMKKLYAVDLKDLPKNIKEEFYSSSDYHTMFIGEIKQFLEKEEQ